MSNVKVDVNKLTNFSEEEKLKFQTAMSMLEHTLNSSKFEAAVMNHEFDQTKGMTNEEIFLYLMSGKDKFNQMADGDIDINLTLYYSWKRTVGYTYPSTYKTWFNRKFFSKYDYGEIAGNVIHEYMHNLGFGHKKPSDKDSVPYAIGYMVRDLINDKVPPARYKKKRTKRRRAWWRFW